MYLVRTPSWLRKLYKSCTWQMPDNEKIIYLTFDDGPHPLVTDFVLGELEKYGAKATFFCIGENVQKYPEVYKRILLQGHSVGNHTQHHLNGWKTDDRQYLGDIEEARNWIDSSLFRPPYGRITHFQLKLLAKQGYQLQPIMWTVLSGDFDQKISDERCLNNVIKNAGNGAIVVFHDSDKAADRLRFALPKVLAHFAKEGYRFEKIRVGNAADSHTVKELR